MNNNALLELYVDNLKDAYSAEKQIIQALPKMIEAANNPELATALTEHLAVTREHKARLVGIFERLGRSSRGKKCKGMEGLLVEGAEVIEDDEDSPTRDAGLVVAAQKVEHYEIAAYGSLRAFASLLGETQAVALLDLSLEEEKEADRLLSGLANTVVNLEAQEPEEANLPRRAAAGRR